MPQCYVTSCTNYYGKTRGNTKVIYHMLPTSSILAAKWAKACGNKKGDRPPPYVRVCSDHFSSDCYQRDLQHELLGLPLRKKLKRDAVPNQNLPTKSKDKKETVIKYSGKNKVNHNLPTKDRANVNHNVKENLITKSDNKVPGDVHQNASTKDQDVKNQLPKCPGKDQGNVLNHRRSLWTNSPKIKHNSDKTNIKKVEKDSQVGKTVVKPYNRLPMRSSIRIAKKKSIESLSDSFTIKVNSKAEKFSKPERFSDKLKFMAKLHLRYERSESFVTRCGSGSEAFFDEAAREEGGGATGIGLNKMQIMEDVREGCNVQPSSPGHAEQRSDNDAEIKTESHPENGYADHNSGTDHNEDNVDDQKEDLVKPSESEGETMEAVKTEFSDANNLNEENYSNASSQSGESSKRKSDSEDFPIKRLRTEIQDNFISRDKILNEFVEMADCNNLEQIHTFSEQLLAEIKTLNELAKEKEREWNNIIHLKKIKEELLLRMQRKRQVMLISDKSDYVDLLGESQNEGNAEERLKSGSPHSILKSNLTNPQKSSLRIPSVSLNGDKSKHRSLLPRYPQNPLDFNGSLDLRQGKQRPILDVQSIIADYRQRHPEAVPRRGRRIRNSQSEASKLNNVLNFSSMALGSGSQVRQNLQGVDMSSELGLLLSSMNGNRLDGSKANQGDSATTSMQDNTSFRDMLLQFARLSQSERNELIQNAIKPPPPYPEVTVHPVPTTTAAPTNSLLHGILTKTPPKQNTKTSFSPTLARLLTAPERAAVSHATSTPTMTNNTTIHPANMSISEILSTSKARNEITITPVGTQYESTPTKARSTEEEEAEDSADRLVIDEGGEAAEARRAADNTSEAGDEVPPCQGCNQKPAQFVCAGCGNQWYCSRDCQVSAWDEHSEVCSG